MSWLLLVEDLRLYTWMISRCNEASGDACVNRHKAKSMSSMAVPDVIPSMSRSNPGLSGGGDGELDDFESPLIFACRASRYLCPTGFRVRPFGAGTRPFMPVAVANFGCAKVRHSLIELRVPSSTILNHLLCQTESSTP